MVVADITPLIFPCGDIKNRRNVTWIEKDWFVIALEYYQKVSVKRTHIFNYL